MSLYNDILPVQTKGMTFDDEFNSFTSSADGSSGTWMTNYVFGGENAYTLTSNDEQEYYSSATVGSNSPFSLSNGDLNITAKPAAPGSNPYNLPYTSGLITTVGSFSQTYGYFEVSAKLPAGQGLWPAFWMLPENGSNAELDVFEQLGNDPSTIHGTTHGLTSGSPSGISQAFSGANTSTAFHTYGMDWEPDTVTFYMDGVKLGSAPTPATANSPMYMLLNLAIGGTGSWPGAVNSSTPFPATMQIDYVRAYATTGTTYVGGAAALTSPTQVIGSGNDVLALSVAEDAYQGDAQFIISVDGQQVGGVQTTTAIHKAGATQSFDVQGNFGAGNHVVTTTFLNDAYGGSPSLDRNLYVTQASLDGSVIRNSSLTLWANGSQSFSFLGNSTAPAYQPTTILGSGSNRLALQLSEDAYLGDAQFTISINGQQIGGTQTATATHSMGATQEFDVLGNFAPGSSHTVSVNFLNDAYGGSPTLDRNLYVNSASIDNTPIAAGTLTEDGGGPQSFTFQKASDTLTLGVSEDAYQGDAQYKVLVDGNYVGGTYTATAPHATGQINTQTISGNWGNGAHTVGVQFINDAYGGSLSLDRNLYINSVNYNGSPVSSTTVEQAGNGTSNFAVAPTQDLTLHLAEDAYQGDAQFTISVDGQVIDQPTAVTALNGAGATQAFDFNLALSAGTHDLGVTFLNDAYGGNPYADRNLYVKGADMNGTPLNSSSWTAPLDGNGTAHFSLLAPS